MTRTRVALLCASALLSFSSLLSPVRAADPTTVASAAAAQTPAAKTQAEVASKTTKFESIAATAAPVKAALDAHDLAGAKANVDKSGAFVGTVTKVYAPKSGKLVILNFNRDYKSALTAAVFSTTFGKFPDLTALTGKKVLISGKIKEFKQGFEIIVASPSQVRIVN